MIVSTCSIFRQIGKKGIMIWSVENMDQLRDKIAERIESLYLEYVDEHLKELNSGNTFALEPIKEDIFLPVYTIMLYAKEIEDNKNGLILNFPPIINHLCYNN